MVDLVVGPWGARPTAPVRPEEGLDESTEPPSACGNCGAVLRYAPGTTSLSCSYCGHVTAIAPSQLVVQEQDLDDALARLGDTPPPSDRLDAQCDGCGASFGFDPPLHAGACPFCGQSVVVAPDGAIEPGAILPFLVGEAEARERIESWLHSLWFAPSHLAKETRGRDAVQGRYLPYFTFDSATETRFEGARGDVHHEMRRVPVVVGGRRSMRTKPVPKVRWRSVAGQVARRFDDVLVAASATVPERLVAGLRRFDTERARPFQLAFLTGFEAERYQLKLSAGFDAAVRQMRRTIEGDVRARIGGDMQRISRLDVQLSERAYKLVLVPVWRAELRFLNRAYAVLVNGRTGAVVGERPYSLWKIATAVAGGLAIVIVLGVGIALAPDTPLLR